MRRRAYAAIALCLILVINTAVATRMDEAESEAEANRWFFSSWFSSGQAAVQTDDRALNAVLKIFGLEAGCRNNSDDLMNQFEGRTGYTCYGINPQSGWNSKDLYPNCGSCQRDKVLFTQCCHNLDPEAFKRNSAKVFVRNYFSPGGCNDLPPAAYFVCGHIALWSGTGRSTQWVKELGPCGRGCNEKEYCNKLNEKHREFLQKVASTEKTEKQKDKHRAWFQKIDDRKRECDNVGSDGSQQQQQGPEKKHTPPTQEQLDAAANIANAVTEAANKAAERLSKDEGPCQNQKDDPANAFLASSESSVGSQSTGWTCLGLSAQNAWERRQLFPECVDCGSNPTDFGKCCHDKNPSAFAKAAKSALVSGLFTPAGCLDLPWPALYACASVAATGSVSIAAAIRKELGPCFPGNGCNVKEFCHKFNNKYKAQWQTSVKGDPKSGAHTDAHQKRHEARARACDEAPASAPFPSASNQSETLKPSDPIPVTVVTGGGSSIPDLGNEPVMKALRSILAHEMDCHNIATDRGNKMANKLGFTCLGLAPSVGWHWRSYFPECDQACNKDPVMFVKCCRDHDPIKFFINAARVYKENYWAQSGCSNLAFPAAHICLDIAINTGTGRAKHYIHEMGPCPASGAVVPSKTHQQSLQPSGPCDAVKYCMEMNEKHKELYVRIPQVDGVQQPFLQGWLDRYEDRKKVCNGQDPVNSQAEAAVQQALAPLTEHAEHADTNGEKCAALGGKCLSTKMPCNGQFVDGSHAPCPGSSRCCVPPAPSQQTNLPPPPPSGPQQTQTTGGHPQQQQNADDGVQDVVNPGGNHAQQNVQQHHQQHQQHQQQLQQPQKPSESTRETLKTGYQGPTAPVFEGGDPGKGLCGEYAKSAKEVAVVTGVLGKKFAVVKALPVHLEEPSIRSKKVEEEDNSMEVHTACAFSTMAAEAKSDRFNVRIKIKKGFRVASRGEEVHGNGLALDFNIDCGAQNESLPSRCRADPVYSWLRLRGTVHGFCRTIKAEPFHWEFRGKGCVHRTDDGQPIQV